MFKWLKREEFTWLNSQGVSSSRGFTLQFTGRFTAEYREGDDLLTFDVESGLTKGVVPCVIVSSDAFRRWDISNCDISPSKQAVIRGNVERALQFQGMQLEVEEPRSFFEQMMQSRELNVQMLKAGKRLSINGVEILSEEALDSFIESHREA